MRYRSAQLLPSVGLRVELGAALSGELVVFRATVVVRCAPTRFDQASPLEAVESGIEGTLADLERRARDLVKALRNSPTVQGFQGDRLQNQKVKCALG